MHVCGCCWLIACSAPDDVLSVMMDDVFDTVVEDGSLHEVSQQIFTGHSASV